MPEGHWKCRLSGGDAKGAGGLLSLRAGGEIPMLLAESEGSPKLGVKADS